ncbi:Calmodulin-dependent protein kinase cmk2 [Neurospora sp. IMI 360204]|nr:Calmodulin-dependent protein kinase cmk2 [Neurospora sp. IMI 360204]
MLRRRLNATDASVVREYSKSVDACTEAHNVDNELVERSSPHESDNKDEVLTTEFWGPNIDRFSLTPGFPRTGSFGYAELEVMLKQGHGKPIDM